MSDPKTFNLCLPQHFREKMKKIQKRYYETHSVFPSKAAIVIWGLKKLDAQDFIDNYREG